MIIGIIGAGAAGMAAALAAAENPDVQVELFERQARVGRKLQATGNGRCNLTNLNPRDYHGEDASFANTAINTFDAKATLNWFESLGLFTVAEDSGRVYPYSDQANSVVDVLRLALQKENIHLHTGCEVTKIRKTGDDFAVECEEGSYHCQKLIIACGGLAGTKLGGTMFGYKLLSKFGHKSTRLRPALVQLKSDWSSIAGLKGVRANCHIKIMKNGEVFSQSSGEIQFTEYGISGPVVFEVSRDVCSEPGQWSCRLDFLPSCEVDALCEALQRRKETDLSTDELLTGILHNRLGRVLTKAAGIKGDRKIAELDDSQLEQVCQTVKDFEIMLTEPLGMDSAHLCTSYDMVYRQIF